MSIKFRMFYESTKENRTHITNRSNVDIYRDYFLGRIARGLATARYIFTEIREGLKEK